MRFAEALSTVRLRYNSPYTFSNSARNLLKKICETSEFDEGTAICRAETWVSVGPAGAVTRLTEGDGFALLTNLIADEEGLLSVSEHMKEFIFPTFRKTRFAYLRSTTRRRWCIDSVP